MIHAGSMPPTLKSAWTMIAGQSAACSPTGRRLKALNGPARQMSKTYLSRRYSSCSVSPGIRTSVSSVSQSSG